MNNNLNIIQVKVHQFLPYLTLAKESTALSLFKQQSESGIELQHLLKQYPDVKYEPLDFYYVCKQFLNFVNEELIAALLIEKLWGWRGAVIAAFLSALAPAAVFEKHLQAALTTLPKINHWIVNLALCEIRGDINTDVPEHQQHLRTITALLALMPKPKLHADYYLFQEGDDKAYRAQMTAAYYKGGEALLREQMAVIPTDFYKRIDPIEVESSASSSAIRLTSAMVPVSHS